MRTSAPFSHQGLHPRRHQVDLAEPGARPSQSAARPCPPRPRSTCGFAARAKESAGAFTIKLRATDTTDCGACGVCPFNLFLGDDLTASIGATGGRVLQNLIVAAQKDASGAETGYYEVDAGERRRKALKRLVKAKTIAKDHPVSCLLIEPQESTEASTAENMVREAMHPADQFEAFRVMVDQGRSAEDVVAGFGVSEVIVHRQLKLANVSPWLMKLYRKDEFGLGVIMAFIVIEDHKPGRAQVTTQPHRSHSGRGRDERQLR